MHCAPPSGGGGRGRVHRAAHRRGRRRRVEGWGAPPLSLSEPAFVHFGRITATHPTREPTSCHPRRCRRLPIARPSTSLRDRAPPPTSARCSTPASTSWRLTTTAAPRSTSLRSAAIPRRFGSCLRLPGARGALRSSFGLWTQRCGNLSVWRLRVRPFGSFCFGHGVCVLVAPLGASSARACACGEGAARLRAAARRTCALRSIKRA